MRFVPAAATAVFFRQLCEEAREMVGAALKLRKQAAKLATRKK